MTHRAEDEPISEGASSRRAANTADAPSDSDTFGRSASSRRAANTADAPSDSDTFGHKIGAGREADVYAWGTDSVIKLYRPGFHGHIAEAVALAALEGHGVAPRLIDVLERDGQPGLVLERLAGSDMLELLQHQPWRVFGLARLLADTHRVVHSVHAPTELPDIRPVLAERIAEADLRQDLRGFVMRLVEGLPAGDRLCHGDFHPGNVLVGADRVGVIDWTNSSRGLPEADHARTILLLRWADPLPGTSPVSRAVIAAGRSALTRAYVRRYRSVPDSPVSQVDSWLAVQIAARLTEGIDSERPTLLNLLERAWRRSVRAIRT